LEQLAKILIFSGIILVIAGLIMYFAGDKLAWLGHLPGDIRIEKENIKIYFPITTLIILSVLISLIIFIIKKLFQ